MWIALGLVVLCSCGLTATVCLILISGLVRAGSKADDEEDVIAEELGLGGSDGVPS